MDRERFSVIAHAKHVFCSPVSASALEALTSELGLRPRSRVVDYGCGTGGMTAWFAETYGPHVDAIERGPRMAAAARMRAERITAPGTMTVHETSAADFAVDAPYDLAIAVGADGLFGATITETLHGLANRVRPRGHILLGDTYWRRPPWQAYLTHLGIGEDAMGSFADMVGHARSAGLEVLAAQEASEADWDDYEARYAAAVEAHLRAHPNDPDAAAMRERITVHQQMFAEHGRSTLGFGLWVLKRR
ncbi:MAG: methyltransferase domain-containing protein [Devosiaceae bacterium]|nr:methyltransferase domain-containing protein [Devosiaceae bacterium MH13]